MKHNTNQPKELCSSDFVWSAKFHTDARKQKNHFLWKIWWIFCFVKDREYETEHPIRIWGQTCAKNDLKRTLFATIEEKFNGVFYQNIFPQPTNNHGCKILN
jgi:hypothetical protein